MAKKKMPKWRTQNLQYTSYNKMAADLARHYIDMDQMTESYKNLVKIAQRRVNAVMKSELPYAKGHKPVFMKPENIITESQLAHEYTDVVKFLQRHNTTVSGRTAQFAKVQKQLKKQGFNITKKNFNKFTNFMDWFYSSKYAAMYDSNQDIVTEVFNRSGKSSRAQWDRLFREFEESGAFD